MNTISSLSTSNVLIFPSFLALGVTTCVIMNQRVSLLQLIEYANPSKIVERVASLNTEDFGTYNPLASLRSGEQRTFVWQVYDHYRFKGYASAAETAEVVREYEPLLDEPYLFLEFAGLLESDYDSHDEFIRAILLWIHHYGLLGLNRVDEGEVYRMPGSNTWVEQQNFDAQVGSLAATAEDSRADYTAHINSLSKKMYLVEEYVARGGPEETATSFIREAAAANRALKLYEAALYRDEKKLKELLDLEGTLERMPDMRKMLEQTLREEWLADNIDALVDQATRQVVMQVQEVLSKYVYPCLNFELSDPWAQKEKLQSPQSLTASLWPRNLLGAMYIQFYWIITSASTLSYCKHCEKHISYAPVMPGSGKRKTYKNKQFCSKQCRQNYDYHHRRKHKRNDS